MIFPDVPIEDPKWTLAAMQYGQIITHDMSMIAGSTQARKLFHHINKIKNIIKLFLILRATFDQMLHQQWPVARIS